MKRLFVRPLIVTLALSTALAGVATTSAQEPEVQVAGAAVPSAGGATPFFGVLDGAVEGRLTPTGNAGAFAGFCVDIEGGGDPLAVRTIFDKVSPGEEDGFGFNLYRIVNGALVESKVIGRSGTDLDVSVSYAAEDDDGGPHFLQVFDYIPGRTVGFSLQVFTVPEEEGGPVELGPGLITEVEGTAPPAGSFSSCADLLHTLPLATDATD